MGGPFWWPDVRVRIPRAKRSVHISPSSKLPFPETVDERNVDPEKGPFSFFFKGKFHLKQPKDVACRPRLESKRLTAAQKSPYMQPLHLDNDDNARRFLWPWPTHWASLAMRPTHWASDCSIPPPPAVVTHVPLPPKIFCTQLGQALCKSHAAILLKSCMQPHVDPSFVSQLQGMFA